MGKLQTIGCCRARCGNGIISNMKHLIVLIVGLCVTLTGAFAVDGEFYPTSDLQGYNSLFDSQWWVGGVVVTGVGATATLRTDDLCRFRQAHDGWTLGHFQQTAGDIYLYPDTAKSAYLTLDAGAGNVSSLDAQAFKCGANLRYHSPLRLTGSGAQFLGRNEFATENSIRQDPIGGVKVVEYRLGLLQCAS